MKSTHKAYIGGFVDGEGCITAFVHPQSKQVYPRIVVSQVDKRPLVWMKRQFGYGYLWKDRGRIWRLRWDARQAEKVLEAITPFLIVKRTQAELALTLFDLETDERLQVKQELSGMKRGVAR